MLSARGAEWSLLGNALRCNRRSEIYFVSGLLFAVLNSLSTGWALIVGGQPTIPTTGGLCKTGNGVNNAGLWIFGRKQARNETQITLARNIATAKGLDVSVLNDIDQTNCTVE